MYRVEKPDGNRYDTSRFEIRNNPKWVDADIE